MFFLMHENVKVASFNVDAVENVFDLQINPKAVVYLPYGLDTEVDLVQWLKNRGIPISRNHIKKELAQLGNITPFGLMLINRGLSLFDHYWILDADNDDYTWEDINCYTNNFRSSMSIDLTDDVTIKDISNKTNFIPSASLKGDLQKKWIIDTDNIRWLVKGNSDTSARQSIAEVIASLVHREQGFSNYTEYDLVNLTHDNETVLGCMCKNFTDINTEFISAYDIVSKGKKPKDMSYYEYFIRLCEYNGLLNVRPFLEYQILTDFVISNSDRHFNNFGVLRDSKTLKWLKCAPIFDSGNSLFYDRKYIPVDRKLLQLEVTSFKKKEAELLSYISNRSIIDLELLPNYTELLSLLHKDTATSEETNERILRAYEKKISYLQDFQNGADIWSYNYKG